MADFQPMQHPKPLQIAQHLHSAANEIALFDNMPEFNNHPMVTLQQVIQDLTIMVRNEMTATRGEFATLRGEFATLRGEMNAVRNDVNTLRNDVNTLRNDVNTLRNDVNAVRNDVTTLRRDMTSGFASLRASIESTDHNARARLENSRISSQDQTLARLRTTSNVIPPNFPSTSEEINNITTRSLDPLLDAYDIAYARDDDLKVKRRLFKKFTGVLDV